MILSSHSHFLLGFMLVLLIVIVLFLVVVIIPMRIRFLRKARRFVDETATKSDVEDLKKQIADLKEGMKK